MAHVCTEGQAARQQRAAACMRSLRMYAVCMQCACGQLLPHWRQLGLPRCCWPARCAAPRAARCCACPPFPAALLAGAGPLRPAPGPRPRQRCCCHAHARCACCCAPVVHALGRRRLSGRLRLDDGIAGVRGPLKVPAVAAQGRDGRARKAARSAWVREARPQLPGSMIGQQGRAREARRPGSGRAGGGAEGGACTQHTAGLYLRISATCASSASHLSCTKGRGVLSSSRLPQRGRGTCVEQQHMCWCANPGQTTAGAAPRCSPSGL